MPYKRYKKKRTTVTKPRTYRRRYYPKRRTRYQINGIRNSVTVKLTYHETLNVTLAPGGFSYQRYQSSANDPDFAVGGHQPMYHDQYIAMYSSCRVHGIAYRITASTDTVNPGCFYMAVNKSPSSTADTSWTYACERKGIRYITVNPGYPSVIKGYMSVAKMYGLSHKAIMAEDDFQCDTSNLLTVNPAKMAYLLVYYFNPNTVNTNVKFQVHLTYYITYFNSYTVANS